MRHWALSLAAHSLPAARGTQCPACPTTGRRQPSLPSPAPSHQPSSAWWPCNGLGTSKLKFFHIAPPHSPGEGQAHVGATSENCKHPLPSIPVPHRNTFKKTSAAAVYEELKESCVFTEGSDCLVIDKSNRAGRKREKKTKTHQQATKLINSSLPVPRSQALQTSQSQTFSYLGKNKHTGNRRPAPPRVK